MSEQAVEAFTSVEQTLAAVEEHLAVFKQESLESAVAELSPLEKAKVQVSLGKRERESDCVLIGIVAVTNGCAVCECNLAYTVNALLYVFLKTQGVSGKDIRQTHVKQELVREC